MQAPATARGAAMRGFTLMEVLLALVLLSLLLAGAVAGVRVATRAVDRGEALIDRTNKLRVAQEFLRRELSQSLALSFEQDPATGEATLFEGDEQELTFVAPMPGYLGHGGPYVQRLSFEQQDGDLRLLFRHALLNGYEADEEPLENPDIAPVPLLEHIAEARFEYRSINDQGELDDWSDEWDKKGRLPLLVRVHVEFVPEENMPWPELVIPIMLDGVNPAARDPFYAPFSGG